MDYQLKLASLISVVTKIPKEKLYFLIKEPTKGIEADWSINCFTLRSFIKKDGNEIAVEIEEKIRNIVHNHPFIFKVVRVGPYLNFILNEIYVFNELFTQVNKNFSSFVRSGFPQDNLITVVIEFPSQNTNKPLHLGHIRNIVLGQTLVSFHEFAGNSVHQVNLLNDRGVHICKSMLAYKRWGRNTTPNKSKLKPDHFVGKYYVTYSRHEAKLKQSVQKEIQELEEERKKSKTERDLAKIKKLKSVIQNSKYGKLQQKLTDMLVKWENGDPEVRKLWSKMNSWAISGFEQTYKIFDLNHEKVYFESNIYDKGREIVLDGLEKDYFVQLDDGAVIARFIKKGLPKEKVLLRSDGTTLYITQDIFLAMQKMKDYNYDMSIYVIGNEQDMQLRTLFEILSILGFSGKNIHYSYGMIYLKSGKMKSREGIIVDADNVVEDIRELSVQEVKNRYSNLSEKELNYRAQTIAMAALRFFILKYEYTRDFIFDLEESISFEGETGVYLLYVYARICSVFNKGIQDNIQVPYNPHKNAQIKWHYPSKIPAFSPYERNLILQLSKYPNVLFDSYKALKPHLLCRYLLELAQFFNIFYHECPILKEEKEIRELRLSICEIVRIILKHGLNLIHIDILTEM